MTDRQYPKISIVTPSFNQAQFIEATIRSITDQGYGDLEYVVVDAGSTDGAAEIIRRYQDRIAHWSSEPDGGMYDGINKGFARTTGEIMAWLNSDDLYFPHTLQTVAEIFQTFPEVEWITTAHPVTWNARGQALGTVYTGAFEASLYKKGWNMGRMELGEGPNIQQESTFWRRSLWDRAGGYVDPSIRLAGDFELWARFFQHAKLYSAGALLGGFRRHSAQKTATALDAYRDEAQQVLNRYGKRRLGPLERLYRRSLRKLLGYRPLYLAPTPVRWAIAHSPFLAQAPLIVWDDDRWRMVTEYVI